MSGDRGLVPIADRPRGMPKMTVTVAAPHEGGHVGAFGGANARRYECHGHADSRTSASVGVGAVNGVPMMNRHLTRLEHRVDYLLFRIGDIDRLASRKHVIGLRVLTGRYQSTRMTTRNKAHTTVFRAAVGKGKPDAGDVRRLQAQYIKS